MRGDCGACGVGALEPLAGVDALDRFSQSLQSVQFSSRAVFPLFDADLEVVPAIDDAEDDDGRSLAWADFGRGFPVEGGPCAMLTTDWSSRSNDTFGLTLDFFPATLLITREGVGGSGVTRSTTSVESEVPLSVRLFFLGG